MFIAIDPDCLEGGSMIDSLITSINSDVGYSDDTREGAHAIMRSDRDGEDEINIDVYKVTVVVEKVSSSTFIKNPEYSEKIHPI